MGNQTRPVRASPEVPPDCGRRLLPVVIDQLARDDPERPWASLPVDDWNLSAGYEDISYKRLASAVNKLAHFIVDHVGRSAPGKFETITYLGVSDIRYHLLQMAVVKTGHRVLFSSQLNTREVHVDLMEQTQSRLLFSAVGVHVRDILAGKEEELIHVLVPELDDLLAVDNPGRPFPYTKTYEEAAHDAFLILHSSGTTGKPKPIVVNHAAFASMDRFAFLASKEGPSGRMHAMEWTHPGKGVRGLMLAPPFHGISSYVGLVRSVFGGGVFVPGFRHRAVGTQDVFDILEHARCTTAIMTPWMMEDVARRTDAGQFMSKVESVYFSGATLSTSASKIWSQHCRIQNAWSSTETSGVVQLMAESEEYEYSVFDLEAAGIKMQNTGAVLLDANHEGQSAALYDMIMVVTPESAPYAFWAHRQGLLTHDSKPVEETRVLETKTGDLWTPHPDPDKSSYVWRFAGRSDDLITFSTGSSLHPGPILRALAESPLVKESIVFGAGRRQPLALIELVDGIEDSEQTVQELWDSVIEAMNHRVPTFGRIARTHMLPVPHGGFARTAKGSASRKEVERKYAARIEDVYSRFGDRWRGDRDRFGSVIVETTISLSTSASEELGPQ